MKLLFVALINKKKSFFKRNYKNINLHREKLIKKKMFVLSDLLVYCC